MVLIYSVLPLTVVQLEVLYPSKSERSSPRYHKTTEPLQLMVGRRIYLFENIWTLRRFIANQYARQREMALGILEVVIICVAIASSTIALLSDMKKKNDGICKNSSQCSRPQELCLMPFIATPSKGSGNNSSLAKSPSGQQMMAVCIDTSGYSKCDPTVSRPCGATGICLVQNQDECSVTASQGSRPCGYCIPIIWAKISSLPDSS
jgi:hypothetical protein